MPDAPAAILETALYAEDLDAAEAFYGDILGLERLMRAENRHVFFKLQGQMLLIFNPAETSGPPSGPLPVPPHGASGPGHVCFATDAAGIEAWRARLESAGIGIESEVDWPQGGRSIYCRDPAGNSVEFAEPRIWGL